MCSATEALEEKQIVKGREKGLEPKNTYLITVNFELTRTIGHPGEDIKGAVEKT